VLSAHIQEVNLLVWKPGQELAVDEIIIRYEGRAKETTTVPNKPTPTGYKVWGVGQRGFLLC
jgi:Transposase IS4